MAVDIRIPLINPNEPEALLVSMYVQEGEFVKQGDLLCTLETTKSTLDVYAEAPGYIVGLSSIEGETVLAGEIFGYLADTADWIPPELPQTREKDEVIEKLGSERITDPARALAETYGLDLSQFPSSTLITESKVREYLEGVLEGPSNQPGGEEDDNRIVIYGGGGHGKSVLELLHALGGFEVVGFIDDGIEAEQKVLGLPVLGNQNILSQLYDGGVRQAVNAVGGIGNLRVRQVVFRRLIGVGFNFPTLVHPTAIVEPSARLSPGVQVFPLAYVGSEVQVGFGSIINTGAIVSHECLLDDLVNISPGAVLAGGVKVGQGALIGMKATVNLLVHIGQRVRVGNGATVKTDVPDGGVVKAGHVWPKS